MTLSNFARNVLFSSTRHQEFLELIDVLLPLADVDHVRLHHLGEDLVVGFVEFDVIGQLRREAVEGDAMGAAPGPGLVDDAAVRVALKFKEHKLH